MLRIDRTTPPDQGASTVEYGIVIASIAALILAGVVAVGRQASAGVGEAGATLGASSGQLDAMAAAATGQPPAAPAVDSAGQQGAVDGTTETPADGGTQQAAASTSESLPQSPVAQSEVAGPSGTSNAATSEPGAASNDPTPGSDPAGAARTTALAAADWSVLSGSADIQGTTVSTTPSRYSAYQNTSVMNAVPWSQPDITLTSTMRLVLPPDTTGFGYGLWLRATPNPSTKTVPSGYSFQVDPGMGNRFSLKIWANGVESLLAMASFPAGFDPKVDNQVTVRLVGEEFVAVVNGTEALRVNNLTDLARAKGLTVPTGTEFGLRVWQKANAVMSGTMVGP